MSGSQVGFTYTPPNLLVPLSTFEVQSAGSQATQTQRALLIGSSRTVQPFSPQQSFGAIDAASKYGPGSMLARMASKYALNDSFGEVWALPINPTSATEAVNTITISGTATSAATFGFYVGDQAVDVAVNVGDTAATVAANLVTALEAVDTLPIGTPTVATSGSSSTITIPCVALGAAGTGLALGINLIGAAAGEILANGLTVAIAQTTPGSGVPTWTDLRPVLGKGNFDLIITGYTDTASLAAIQALLSDASGRWSPTSQLYGHCLGAIAGTEAAMITAGAAMNDQHRTIFGYPGVPTPPWEQAAAIGGAIFPSQKADPGRPVQTLPVLGIMAPPAGELAIADEQKMLSSGIALVTFDAGGNCTVLRAVTTYETNAYGVQDEDYQDTETLFELMAFVRRLQAVYALTFPRVKLADNGTHFGAGVAVVTPNDVRNAIVAEYAVMESEGLVEDTAAFAAALVVVRNATNPGRIDTLLDPTMVSGLRLIANLVKFSLTAPPATSDTTAAVPATAA